MSGAELARRAVACPGWRWMPGMRSLAHPYTLEGREFIAPARRWSEGDGFPKDGRLPDLDDPATLGCLLALVREAWGSHVSSIRTGDGWSVRHMGRDGWAVGLSVVGITQCETEAEALVAALEAAPRREAS